jgi:hypothetical protein
VLAFAIGVLVFLAVVGLVLIVGELSEAAAGRLSERRKVVRFPTDRQPTQGPLRRGGTGDILPFDRYATADRDRRLGLHDEGT